MTPKEDTRDPLRPKRRFSVWTLLAPVALLVFVGMSFHYIGESCVLKSCDSSKKSDKSSDEPEATATRELKKGEKPSCLNTPKLCPKNAMRTVQDGDTLSGIAEQFQLTEDELKACNPKVDPQTLNKGDKLFISPARCKGADLAETGANPDLFSDDTSVAAESTG